MKFSFLVCILFIGLSYVSTGTTLFGKAIRILDGDTFELMTSDFRKIKIRLTDIDAPEKKQAFGNKSKQTLANYIFSKEVKVEYDLLDRNKRILGRVYVNDVFINMLMVQNGMAWHFKKYSKDERFAQAEVVARKAKRGLWIDKNPIAPWNFRKIKH
jgi:micrococcal nuclease